MSFGRDGAPILMMREWAEVLTRHLGVDASLVGLSTTLDGPAFEERLGVCFQRVAALKLAGPMLEDLARALGPEPSASAAWEGIHTTVHQAGRRRYSRLAGRRTARWNVAIRARASSSRSRRLAAPR
jgi:hypothetical protein